MLNIDRQSRTPVYEQIINQLERLILTDIIKPQEQIPSVRALSAELSINPNTIQKAYNDLEKRGITISVPGVGRFVAENARGIINANRSEELERLSEITSELALTDIALKTIIDTITQAYNRAKKLKGKRDNCD